MRSDQQMPLQSVKDKNAIFLLKGRPVFNQEVSSVLHSLHSCDSFYEVDRASKTQKKINRSTCLGYGKKYDFSN